MVLRLASLMRPFTGWVLLSILLGCAAAASSIGLLGASASIIARAALHPSIATLQVAIVGVRFFGVSRGVFRYLERLSSHSVNLRLLARLRGWFYRTVEPVDPLGLVDMKSGDLLNRAIGDIDTLENFYVRAVAPAVIAVVIILGVGWYAGSIYPAAGWALVVGLLTGSLLLPLFAFLVSRSAGRALVDARAKISAALVEGLQGISDLIAFGWGGAFLERIRVENRRFSKAQRTNGWLQAGLNALSLITAQLTALGVLWLAIPGVRDGQVEGYLLAVLALVALASFEAVTPLPQAAQQLESCLQAARRLFALADRTGLVGTGSHTTSGGKIEGKVDLSIQHLTYRYPGSAVEALRDINLELPAGKKLAVVGPSGAGKSTLANLLLRLLPDSSGAIRLNGRVYQDYAEDEFQNCFAVIAQASYMFSASLRQNLMMAKPEASEEELFAVIERSRLNYWLESLPEGLDTWIGEHGLRLSGGERQRLGLARILLKDSPVFLLDEPTAHLDALLERQILAELLQACAEKSLILITHRLAGMERMDEIVVLDGGEIVESGTHVDLLARNGLYARMWAAQQLMAEPAGHLL